MDGDGELEAITALLADEYAREILAETSTDAMSATTLSERCDAAPATVYDRIERLCEQELLRADQQLDAGGHHYKTYRARLDRVIISLDDGRYTVRVARDDPTPADRFSSLVDDLK